MSNPVRAGDGPIAVEVEAGKSYWWCSCGRSAKQPFCDGSHKDTGFTPLKYDAPETRTAYFCACKATANQPLCDGSHSRVRGQLRAGRGSGSCREPRGVGTRRRRGPSLARLRLRQVPGRQGSPRRSRAPASPRAAHGKRLGGNGVGGRAGAGGRAPRGHPRRARQQRRRDVLRQPERPQLRRPDLHAAVHLAARDAAFLFRRLGGPAAEEPELRAALRQRVDLPDPRSRPQRLLRLHGCQPARLAGQPDVGAGRWRSLRGAARARRRARRDRPAAQRDRGNRRLAPLHPARHRCVPAVRARQPAVRERSPSATCRARSG